MKIYNIENNFTRQIATLVLFPIIVMVLLFCSIVIAVSDFFKYDYPEWVEEAIDCMKVREIRYKHK